MLKRIFLSILWMTLFLSCQGDSSTSDVDFSYSELQLIPKPKELELHSGGFTFDAHTQWVTQSEEEQKAAQLLIDKFKKATSFDYRTTTEEPDVNAVVFSKDTTLAQEEYKLNISKEKIHIRAATFSGFVYGVESLRLLLPAEIEVANANVQQWLVPTLEITDAPQFAWRGVMLDVVRHFFPKEYIFQTIDVMAMLKLNVLHLHLIDDQGWRLEIKKYPKLTEVGAWRVDQEDQHWDDRQTNDPNEKGTYGGFYTQEDIKEIVAYAHQRGIAVMPEIEMPAHVSSAIASYPKLSCKGEPIAVPSGGLWPITDIYCAGNEATFTFLEDVLEETMALFPDEYIHIGGDEATKTEWKKCPKCQKRMRDEGLKSVEELQSYFVKRIEEFIHSKGRKLIGWDEIIEGGLPARAAVMSWRGMEGGIKAAKDGHFVVMTPGTCYLNQYQGLPDMEPLAFGGYVPLKQVYDFLPVTDKMTKEQQSFVLGAQANLWSEFITDKKMSEYMLYPRLFALSEALWSSDTNKNWEDFILRLENLKKRFDLMKITVSDSRFQVVSEIETKGDEVLVSLKSEYPNADIRYTINEEDLQKAIPYKKPFSLRESSVVRAAIFRDGQPTDVITTDTLTFHKAVGKKVSFTNRYHDSYQGQQEKTFTNIIRGTTNFHDQQWLAWLVEDAEFTIDLEESQEISSVTVGSMKNQAQGIYYPTQIIVSLSTDGKNFTKASELDIPFEKDGYPELKDFVLKFEKTSAQFVKVKIKNLGHPPKGGDAWMFFDEIIIQ